MSCYTCSVIPGLGESPCDGAFITLLGGVAGLGGLELLTKRLLPRHE
jgi:hypothetical protein